MCPLMPVKVGADIETLATVSAPERALACMRAPMFTVV